MPEIAAIDAGVETVDIVLSAFAEWLSKVDGSKRRLRPEFLVAVEKVFLANGIHEHYDLIGCTMEAFKRSSIADAGMFGFMQRTVKKANDDAEEDFKPSGAFASFRVLCNVLIACCVWQALYPKLRSRALKKSSVHMLILGQS